MTTDSDSECSYAANLTGFNVIRVIIIVIVLKIIVIQIVYNSKNSNYSNNRNSYSLLLLSCHQTAFFHLSTHFLAFSLNL